MLKLEELRVPQLILGLQSQMFFMKILLIQIEKCSSVFSHQDSEKRLFSLQKSDSRSIIRLWVCIVMKSLVFIFIFLHVSDDEEQIVTPFAQILATLKDVRSNLSILVARGSGAGLGGQERQSQKSFLHPPQRNTPTNSPSKFRFPNLIPIIVTGSTFTFITKDNNHSVKY